MRTCTSALSPGSSGEPRRSRLRYRNVSARNAGGRRAQSLADSISVPYLRRCSARMRRAYHGETFGTTPGLSNGRVFFIGGLRQIVDRSSVAAPAVFIRARAYGIAGIVGCARRIQPRASRSLIGSTLVLASASAIIRARSCLPCARRMRAKVFRRSVSMLVVYLNDGSRTDFIAILSLPYTPLVAGRGANLTFAEQSRAASKMCPEHG